MGTKQWIWTSKHVAYRFYSIKQNVNSKLLSESNSVCMLTVWRRVWPSAIFCAHHAGFSDKLMLFATRKLNHGTDDMAPWCRIFDQQTVKWHDWGWTQNFWNKKHNTIVNILVLLLSIKYFLMAKFKTKMARFNIFFIAVMQSPS